MRIVCLNPMEVLMLCQYIKKSVEWNCASIYSTLKYWTVIHRGRRFEMVYIVNILYSVFLTHNTLIKYKATNILKVSPFVMCKTISIH